jgi:hypothetical protein
LAIVLETVVEARTSPEPDLLGAGLNVLLSNEYPHLPIGKLLEELLAVRVGIVFDPETRLVLVPDVARVRVYPVGLVVVTEIVVLPVFKILNSLRLICTEIVLELRDKEGVFAAANAVLSNAKNATKSHVRNSIFLICFILVCI